MTAATTRIVRTDSSIDSSPCCGSGRCSGAAPSSPLLHGNAEQLLAHEQDVPVDDLALPPDAHERAVGAPEIREQEVALVGREPAVQARDVAVLGEEDVAAL